MKKDWNYQKLEPPFSKPYLDSIARMIEIAVKSEKSKLFYPAFLLFKLEKIRYLWESRRFRRKKVEKLN